MIFLDVPASWRIVHFWQFCAVKMPPRSLMNNSTLNHVWSQNCCTDLYGLKGSSLLRHWPHPTSQLGVVRCALVAFVNTTNCDVALHCSALWSPALHRVWPEHAANAKMPSHLECVCSFFDGVCMCALAVQRIVVPKYRTVMSPHGWEVSPASKLWTRVACQSSVWVPALSVERMLFHHETLSDSIVRCLDCLIQLQLSCFFKLTYALA